jgi:hypothetical protein
MTLPSHDRPLSDDEQAVVEDWIANADATRQATDVVRFARYVPELGWRAILSILALPDARAHLAALARTLRYLVVKFGDAFIDRIEIEAAINPAFHDCLGKLRSDPVFPIPVALWSRLSAAAGRTVGPVPQFAAEVHARFPRLIASEHDDPEPLPPDDAPLLTDDELRDYARAWITHTETEWAWNAFAVTSIKEPWTTTWPLLLAIVNQGSDRAVARLGDETLSDLIRVGAPALIDRVKAEAATNARFRYCLSFAEPPTREPERWAWVVKARGDEPQRSLHTETEPFEF